MPSTLLHAVFPATAAGAALWGSRVSRRSIARVAFVAAILGNAPDWDLLPAALFVDHWREIHRAWGHNLLSAVAWIAAGHWLLRRAAPELGGRAAAAISALAVLSHLILDAGTYDASTGAALGVPLFWPITSFELVLPWRWFPTVEVAPAAHPILGHATASDYWAKGAWVEARAAAAALAAAFVTILLSRRPARPGSLPKKAIETSS